MKDMSEYYNFSPTIIDRIIYVCQYLGISRYDYNTCAKRITTINVYEDDNIIVEHQLDDPINRIRVFIKLPEEPHQTKVFYYSFLPADKFGRSADFFRPGRWLDYITTDLWEQANSQFEFLRKMPNSPNFKPINDYELFTN